MSPTVAVVSPKVADKSPNSAHKSPNSADNSPNIADNSATPGRQLAHNCRQLGHNYQEQQERHQKNVKVFSSAFLAVFVLLVSRAELLTSYHTALHRVKHKPWAHGKNCSKRLGLVKQQIKLCRDNLDLMPSIARASSLSVETCQSQFSDRRWNCSSIGRLPARSKDLVRGTREKAYVYGIASAALVHTVARACSIGVTTKCSCGILPNSAPSGTFKWGGCGDDVHFGMYFGERFTDPTLRSKKGKVKKSTKAMMDEHNFAAGRAVVRESLTTACKCHGVSGSCSIKTCWKALPDFDSIGATLKQRYALAVEVKRRKRKKEHVLLPIQPGKGAFAEDELIYYAKSPDYCSPDEKTGSVGTRG
ncbi:hypothetical protein BaRGS_00025999, partial [Batillaria attramentaria]